MSLPATDLKASDVDGLLNIFGLGSIQISSLCLNSNVNKWGLNPLFVSGADADARLANLRSTPYSLGKFRGYNHFAPAPGNNTVSTFGSIQDTVGDKLVGNIILQEVGGRSTFINVETIAVDERDFFGYIFNTATTTSKRIDASDIRIRPLIAPETWGSPQMPNSVSWSSDDVTYTAGAISDIFTPPFNIYFRFLRG